MAGRMARLRKGIALGNLMVLAASVSAAHLMSAGPASVTAEREVTVEEGFRLIAAQAGSYTLFLVFEGTLGSAVPKGESTTLAPGAIAIDSFSLAAENPTAIGTATSGTATGKVKLNQLTVAKSVDLASTTTFRNVASAGTVQRLTLYVRRAGATASYLTWQFAPVSFEKVEWSGDKGALKETLTMFYASLRISYSQTSSTGIISPPVTSQWNQVTNTATFSG